MAGKQMRVLVTGGTGFIGRALCRALLARGDEVLVLSRQPEQVAILCGAGVIGFDDIERVRHENIDAVINLAGESIAGARWSEARKQVLRDSRITLTENLCENLAANPQPPSVFISGSATGIYGDGGDRTLIEGAERREGAPEIASGEPKGDFARQLCQDWESAADRAAAFGARVVILRTGLVMGPDGGFLAPLKLPFSLGLGARLGRGDQWMSWISLSDMVRVILYVLDHKSCRGAYNASAPHPATNLEFTRTFARLLHRPALFVAPEFFLKAMLGELATLLLAGQRAVPARLQDEKFIFHHQTLTSALATALD